MKCPCLIQELLWNNMTLEKVVNIFGNSLSTHFVVKRQELPTKGPFKGIKTYRIELWEVGEHKGMLSIDKTCQITDENRKAIIEGLEERLIKLMFDYYASE